MSTPGNYIAALPVERQEAMRTLRTSILQVLPDLKETMHYKMPTYVSDGLILCSIASQKQYMALYVMPYDLLEAFQEELNPYNCGKSCIRFKTLGDEEIHLFERILVYAKENYSKSTLFGKYKA